MAIVTGSESQVAALATGAPGGADLGYEHVSAAQLDALLIEEFGEPGETPWPAQGLPRWLPRCWCGCLASRTW